MTPPLRSRQIHLDFHTSPEIPGIGADFDPDEFAATLEKARVNSITCFARCHHGMLYYQSKLFPERIHPNLVRPNLLPDQIEACHKRGIRVPIYVTVQWDEFSADRHRDWLHIDEDGREFGTRPLDPGFYRWLDVFHPEYRKFLFDHVGEILNTMPVDGLFFDIVQSQPSLSFGRIQEMDRRGLNPESPVDRLKFSVAVIREWEAEMSAFVRAKAPEATIFYNSGHVGTKHRPSKESYTHYELESLPSGGWGYLHFPQAMRYGRTLGHECLGMTGKFHTSWGDFGSYKNPVALQFECFHMLALGARCSVGDQLPPRGRLDAATYELVGSVYAEVEKKEPWVLGAKPVCDVALLTTEEQFDEKPDGGRHQNNVLGAVRMLQELRVNFDIVDTKADFTPYRVLVLPDSVLCTPVLAEKLETYVFGGGSLLVSHKSGLDEFGKFGSPVFGVEAVGDAPFSPDFFVPGGGIGSGLPDTGHVMYQKALEVTPLSGSEVLARVQTPYFNRNWRHFCSHAHTPSEGKEGYPSVVKAGRVIYLAHPVFAQYHDCAPLWVKTIVRDALKQLLPDPVLEVDGPSCLISTLTQQPEAHRYVVHLLGYTPERRGTRFDILEDVLPILDITIRARVAGVSTARLVPSGDSLPLTLENGVATITLPRLDGHAMIELG
ncbi:MAG: beta-galactosidase trimerization domain-containing protein [Armatimonas sp.]